MESTVEQSSHIQSLSKNVLVARYTNHAQEALDAWVNDVGSDTTSLHILLNNVEATLSDQDLNENCPDFPDYVIPPEILERHHKLREYLLQKCRAILTSEEITLDQVKGFLLTYHSLLKCALNQWLLASYGVVLEIYNIPADIPEHFEEWLHNQGANIRDEVIQRHVVSNKSRLQLQEMGFTVPHMYYAEEYYREVMHFAAEILSSAERCKGVFAQGSWIYDPKNYQPGPNGEDLVRFGFLQDDKLVGNRTWVADVTTPGFEKYLQFALSNSDTRRDLHEKGLYTPQVWGAFYPREEVIKNKDYFSSQADNI